jgi:hypothetical protein
LTRYQSLSSELLRISILGIGTISVLFAGVSVNKASRLPLFISSLIFVIGASSSLMHLYWSSESMQRRIEALRGIKQETGNNEAAFLRKSHDAIIVSSVCIGLAALFLAVGIAVAIFLEPATTSTPIK